MDFYETIEFNKESFTKTERIIYEGVINNLELIERYTVMQLSAYLKVSHSAIMRFCRKLGYSGYSEFRYAYMKYAHTDFQKEGMGSLGASVISLNQNAIATLNEMPDQRFAGIAGLIQKYDSIKAIGFGKSSIPGLLLKYNFIRFSKYIIVDNDSVILNDYEKVLSHKDLVFIFSVSASSERISKLVRNVYNAKAHSILITCNPKSNNIRYVTESVILPTVINKGETLLCNHIAMGVFVDILTSYYAKYYI